MSNCKICGELLEPLLDFGEQPLANRLVTDPSLPELKYKAVWSWCKQCELLQLENSPAMTEMFTNDYPYLTDSSKAMVDHFAKTATEITSECGLNEASLVVEIGANTGEFLGNLKCKVFGFEPALEALKALQARGVPATPVYFNGTSAQIATAYWKQPVDLVYSANTLRSILGLDEIFKGVTSSLRKDGWFVFEEPYLVDILRENALDQFYDENVWCFTVKSVELLAKRFGMTLVRVRNLDTHGGSMRYYLQEGAHAQDESVYAFSAAELSIPADALYFMKRVRQTAMDFVVELSRHSGLTGYGATAKSTTLLNYAKVNRQLLTKIYDTTPSKHGKFTAGTHIPIVDAKGFADDESEVVVLFAWNHAAEIMKRETKKRKWLVYVPEVRYL